MVYDFSGKVALVTGAASRQGIGYATALRLARDGANVAVVDKYMTSSTQSENDRIEDWKGLDSVVKKIESLGQQGMAIVVDVTDSKQVEEMVGTILEKFGRIDILVNNAGIMADKANVLEATEENFKKVLGVNLVGPFICAKAVVKEMLIKGDSGKIINIASTAGKLATTRGIAAYGASKAGLINLTQTLALELAKFKINVNAVCPGSTATELTRGRQIISESRRLNISVEEATAQIYSDLIRSIPLGRIAQPEDAANAVAFLASAESDHITGIALNVTGGRLMVP